jgi:hypothetical protein
MTLLANPIHEVVYVAAFRAGAVNDQGDVLGWHAA